MDIQPETTLYERIGGKHAVHSAVDLFYEKVTNDKRLATFFGTVDMKRQRAHQRAFLTFAFGGAPDYNGPSLRKAHAPLVENKGLSEEHFDAFCENLRGTLEELEVFPEMIDEVMAIVYSAKLNVLNL